MLGMEDMVSRMWDNLISRPSGPYGFRFFIATDNRSDIRDTGRATGCSYGALALFLDDPDRDGEARRPFA
jgi:hypothetical protein